MFDSSTGHITWVSGSIPDLGSYRRQPVDVLSHIDVSLCPPSIVSKSNEKMSMGEGKKIFF